MPSKPSIFTFVPVVRKLPIESVITEEERSGALTGKPNKVQQQQQIKKWYYRRLIFIICNMTTAFSAKCLSKLIDTSLYCHLCVLVSYFTSLCLHSADKLTHVLYFGGNSLPDSTENEPTQPVSLLTNQNFPEHIPKTWCNLVFESTAWCCENINSLNALNWPQWQHMNVTAFFIFNVTDIPFCFILSIYSPNDI